MIIELKIKKEFDVKYLLAKIGVRYWEDSTVNGSEDVNGDLIPCREKNAWCPVIELSTGKITNWRIGDKAEIHYKSCDSNIFSLLDENLEEVIEIEGYVIDMMCPKKGGYGDYVIMSINEDGIIQNFKADLGPFIEENEN